ncbi:uncharacterized protein ColSpa_03709 [Colletotrichum spaethianum]|uniref:Uncharacterized protein n=1 Tax=Colletotrichum spaethianum TaxID=700344 RepID=A0AA37L806_9PEZI|nr:uncharacterized protein ColSpa_03709 [Colletotrichum spaethianum]GKT43528.1 hypothetical protein ColSpa_03709 [Colletotrichum spaethianum]
MDEDPKMPELLATLLGLPEDLPYTPDENLSPYYTRKWGFTIYRTPYGGPESDKACPHSDPHNPELRDASLDRLHQFHADNTRTGKALPNEDWALSIIFFVADQ